MTSREAYNERPGRERGPLAEPLLARIRQSFPQQPTTAQVVEAYELTLTALIRHLALLIGPLGVQAVVDRALQRAVRQRPLLRHVYARLDGPDLSGLTQGTEELDPAAADAILVDLVNSLFEVLASLLGRNMLGPILQSFGEQPGTPGREV